MSKVIHIGNLVLNMGTVSHAVGLPKIVKQREKFLQYNLYQFHFKGA